MAHVLLDRAKVVATSMSGNTSNYALTNSPPTGFVDFTGVGDGNTTYYTAVDDAGNWEVGIGTFASSGEVLTRTDANVIKSTNSNNRVSWPSSSTPTVFITQPSDKAVYFDASSASSTSILNTGLVVGRDADNQIKFGTDNQIIFEVDGGDNVIFKTGGEIEASSLDISGNADIDGTLYADAISNGGGITFETGTDGITFGSSSNNDVTIIRTGNDATQYGFNVKYMGARSGTANSFSIFSDNVTGGLASRECLTIYQDGKVGINWATPTYNLHVSGTGRISEDLSVGDDLSLQSDSAVLNFGTDSDVSLTHVHNDGLLLNSDNQLQFGDNGTYIYQSADGVLDLVSDTEIEINATTIDINGAGEVSGNLDVGGSLETATIDYTDGDNAITIADGGGTTFPQTATFTSGIQSNGTVTVGVDDTGHDVKFFGATSGKYMEWDESADQLNVSGTLTAISTDTGSGSAPLVQTDRDSASPADWDFLGGFQYYGRNDADESINYAGLYGRIVDASDGTEDGRIEIYQYHNGTSTWTYSFDTNYFYFINEQSIQWYLHGGTSYDVTLTPATPTADRTITLPDATGTILTSGNADLGTTTTSSSDVDHVLVNDGGVLKKITVANLGTATTDDATALAIALG